MQVRPRCCFRCSPRAPGPFGCRRFRGVQQTSHGDFKVQVLTSALMSVSALPWDQSFSKTWLLNSTFQELCSRWEELEVEGQAQVAVALERVSVKCTPLFNSLLSIAGRSFQR